MPLLDIAISQPCSCFCNNILAFRQDNKLVVGNDRGLGLSSAFSWRTLHITKRVGKNLKLGENEVWRGGLIIKAVATLELTSVSSKKEGVKNGYQNMLRMDIDSVRSNGSETELQSSSEDSTEADEREKLRRMRISKANKGNTPWNKGRKHSPETLQRIKERTRLAMQDPKVKMKLVNLGHAQSEDTRVKIGVGVRLGWARRREKLMVQETCHYEWQNLIAVAAREGLSGEEELQWDSYKILTKQLDKEWLHSVEERKNMARPKGSKRAPKSAEQKRKISEAISAKWADAEYRNRVWSGLAKFHGISERVERKPKRKPCADGQTKKRSAKKKDEIDNLTNHEIQRVRLKRSKAPLYKDPFASSKLEMLKNIRAQRAAPMNQKSEAITRAKLLIAEAEKAAKALEIAAQNSPHVQTSLIESRTLIAEAIQFLGSIKNEDPFSFEDENYLSENSAEPLPHVEEEIDGDTWAPDIIDHGKVNGVHTVSASDIIDDNLSFNKFVPPELVNGNASSFCHNDLLETEEKHYQTDFALNITDPKPNPKGNTGHVEKPLVNGLEFQPENAEVPKGQVNIIKKWFRGRLVEVAEES
ncbi:hypothetical protein BUALT_Bualt02G0127100 [Buddleja alternifolia]|uniref:Nuclease associated modular domain-containing protein n=1 Tax=Buddleja alternifolia TaxID=168488 RepID=A0AAV6YAJ1_9LAMI|nr:hypothetical protein BUALT_Bualt02G0127100 [Buddleja alternifolia]